MSFRVTVTETSGDVFIRLTRNGGPYPGISQGALPLQLADRFQRPGEYRVTVVNSGKCDVEFGIYLAPTGCFHPALYTDPGGYFGRAGICQELLRRLGGKPGTIRLRVEYLGKGKETAK